MLWLRRIIAGFLALVFVVLFIPLLVVFRVNATILNPNFYVDQLRRADTYNFLYSDVLPQALERADLGGPNLSWTKSHLLFIANQTVPPPWLQTQTEQVIKAALPYVCGDTQNFRVTVPLKDRAQAAASAIKSTLHQEAVTTRLYDQAIDSLLANVKGLPLPLNSSEMKTTVRTVLPPDWVLKQADYAIDECVPYFTKDKEHFLVRVNFVERLDSLKAVVIDMLKKPETYDYFCRETMVKSVMQQIQQTQLPVELTLTNDEILSVIRQALPLSWYQARVPDIVEPIFAYLGGTKLDLQVVISLADRKPAIAEALGQLVDQKLASKFDPAAYDALKKLLGIDVVAVISPLLSRAMPDQLVLTDAQLSQALGSTGGANPLVTAREWLQKGLTYSDQDLRTSLGANQGGLDDVRQLLSGGFTFTEKELRGWMGTGDDFDNMRSTLGTVRRLLWLAWLLPALILVAIGGLSGRRWSSKLIWAATVLTIAALIAVIIFGPVFSATVQPQVSNKLMQLASQPDVLQALVAGKAVTIAQNAIDSFIGGVRTQTIIWLVVGLVLIGGGCLWHYRKRKTSEETTA